MKWLVLSVLFCSMSSSVFAAEEVTDLTSSTEGGVLTEETAAEAATAVNCNLKAAVFSNVAFTTKAAAQASCDALVAQTGLTGSCTVVRQAANKFVAKFLKNLAVNNKLVAQLLTDLNNFLVNNKVLVNKVVNNALKVQLQLVGQNCN